MLNTLALVRSMTAAGLPPKQAEAVAEALASAVDDDIASKRDIAEVRKDILTIEANLKRDLAELKRDMMQIEANLKRDIKELEVGMKRDIKELELKMDKGQADAQRNTLQVGLAMAALVITVLGLMFRFMGR